MTEPETEAGRRLLVDIERVVWAPIPGAREAWTADILAIEAEARAGLDVERLADKRDANRWREAEAEGHIVDFTEAGYGLVHPPSCRPRLIECEYNEWLAASDGPEMPPGRYRMVWEPTDAQPDPQYAALARQEADR